MGSKAAEHFWFDAYIKRLKNAAKQISGPVCRFEETVSRCKQEIAANYCVLTGPRCKSDSMYEGSIAWIKSVNSIPSLSGNCVVTDIRAMCPVYRRQMRTISGHINFIKQTIIPEPRSS
jgi:hypothetical protein